MDALKREGLEYVDEATGETKVIPRANIDDDGYKYTMEDQAKKDRLMKSSIDMYPDLDKVMIEILVDHYMNHGDKLEQMMKEDKEYMKRFKQE
tara:strand:- start:1096 stop:1374 length:279 start_codon:yes stop_codon:yes gene_type:complete